MAVDTSASQLGKQTMVGLQGTIITEAGVDMEAMEDNLLHCEVGGLDCKHLNDGRLGGRKVVMHFMTIDSVGKGSVAPAGLVLRVGNLFNGSSLLAIVVTCNSRLMTL